MKNPWDLYLGHPDFTAATHALNHAWESAKRISPELPSKDRAEAARDVMHSVMEQYRAAGALDTEPREILSEMLRKQFG